MDSPSDSTFSDPISPKAPSSTSTTPPSRSPIFQPANEKQQLLDNISHFVPVGVLWSPKQSSWSVNAPPTGEYPDSEVVALERNGWIRTFTAGNEALFEWLPVRVFVLPDDIGRKVLSRSSPSLRRALRVVMSRLDRSRGAWDGNFEHCELESLDQTNTESESLFYIFNTLESPNPSVRAVSDPWAKLAIEELLLEDDQLTDDKTGIPGLKTTLYPYQRRSAALMVQKEAEPGQSLDPRLQKCHGPTGRSYYYDKEEGSVMSEKRMYSNACGGILAETMGFGKTLICLAVILATKGHFPVIPPEHLESRKPLRNKTGSLFEMAAATAGRHSIPFKSYFDRLGSSGLFYEKCLTACERNRGFYTIFQKPRYGHRVAASSRGTCTHLRLSSGTLIIVPPNLVDHWLQEIAQHTKGLKVLVLKDNSSRMLSACELLHFDIILFSKRRFEQEIGGFSASDSKVYNSPLKELHWLRLIVDEGHNFASSKDKSNAMYLLDKLHVERRWIVSGTPSRGLYGIEISLASQETTSSVELRGEENKATDLLQARKEVANVLNEELKNLDKLKRMVVDFLNLKPWSNSRASDPANWTKYIKPLGPDGNRQMAPSLRATLQSLVVRHRTEDIDREVSLPKLYNKVVYLEPTFHDKLSINLFILHLTVNAITSERTDKDYMFHPKNKQHLSQLVNNLRHAGFWWTGFEKDHIETTLGVARKYFEKNSHRISEVDVALLQEAIDMGELAIGCRSWNGFSRSHEIGIYVDKFPENARDIWAIDNLRAHQQPLLLGISLARQAQKFVTAHLCASDPSEGMAGAGIRARLEKEKQLRTAGCKAETRGAASQKANDQLVHQPKPNVLSPKTKKNIPSHLKSLPSESPLKQTKFVATASAKLTYLLDKVLEFQESEKIIIFYENNNTAFWIAEGLEMLGVDFRIYSNTLRAASKSQYLSLFNESASVRVLLMDLRQAAHGLHIACASRVFIVNPIWDPNIESQAIKRAHRISQNRPVYVETLVLENTLEDRMLKRRKQMSSAELQHAEKDLLDDNAMNHIIQTEGFLSVPHDEALATPAYLKNPPGFFDRHQLSVPNTYREPVLSTSPRSATTGLHSLRPATAKSKRKTDEYTPWVESDVTESSTPGNTPKKRRTATTTNNVVTETGVVLVMPKSRSPRKQQTSSTSEMHSNAGNLFNGPSGSASVQQSLYGSGIADLHASATYDGDATPGSTQF